MHQPHPDVNNQPRITRWHNRRRAIPSRSGTIRGGKVRANANGSVTMHRGTVKRIIVTRARASRVRIPFHLFSPFSETRTNAGEK